MSREKVHYLVVDSGVMVSGTNENDRMGGGTFKARAGWPGFCRPVFPKVKPVAQSNPQSTKQLFDSFQVQTSSFLFSFLAHFHHCNALHCHHTQKRLAFMINATVAKAKLIINKYNDIVSYWNFFS